MPSLQSNEGGGMHENHENEIRHNNNTDTNKYGHVCSAGKGAYA